MVLAAPPIEVIAAGRSLTCVLAGDTTVRCWGSNTSGTLGTGKPDDSHTPVLVPDLTGVNQLWLGEDHVFARTADGVVRSWGNNDHGELGEGTTDDRRTPARSPGSRTPRSSPRASGTPASSTPPTP